MKKITKALLVLLMAGAGFLACKDDFLDRPPIGGLDETTLANAKGVDATLIGAYSLLDGWAQGWGNGAVWTSAASNWVYGGICGGDAHKGSDASDQPAVNPIERYEGLADNEYFRGKWRVVYDGVARSNSVLKLAVKATDISASGLKQVQAEARFLRGHYHFEAKRMWNMVPYIDETITDYKVANDKDIWPNIEADFKFAYDNLPETQAQVGRINKWAAAAMLAKTYMYQKKYNDAKPLLETIIANGKTSNGLKYGLNDLYADNFQIATKNNKESVFVVQTSVNDGADGENGNYGDVLNFPYTGGPGECCGFYQPSQELVNSHRTDKNGLPLLDGSYNLAANEVKSDQGIPSDKDFTPDAGNLDPRLDWSVGRRGIPYLDWGPHPGQAWIRDQAYSGPYAPKKHVFKKSEKGSGSTASGWAQGASANNVNLIRFADILLWAAECEVEIGSLAKAQEYVNLIRKRAANPAGFVKTDAGKNAANYVIDVYKTAWTDKNVARNAVQFERKLELAMEGHRFFDLVRWGVADVVLNAYIAYESKLRPGLVGARFTKGKAEYFPIPRQEIVASSKDGKPTLTQNPGYN
ncbi:MAG: RagB/SusD family nutrient uptake outer membrane protein [Spirosomataceae bacterium]